eukprot:1368135-Amorphochlora_amoeboformis.AAC.2
MAAFDTPYRGGWARHTRTAGGVRSVILSLVAVLVFVFAPHSPTKYKLNTPSRARWSGLLPNRIRLPSSRHFTSYLKRQTRTFSSSRKSKASTAEPEEKGQTVRDLLANISGEEAAQRLSKKHPNLARSQASESFSVLVEMVGIEEAKILATGTPHILRTPVEELRSARLVLERALGVEGAQEVIRILPGLLDKNSQMLENLLEILECILGEDDSKMYLMRCPSLLTSQPERIKTSWKQV